MLKQCAREISNPRPPQTLKIDMISYHTICNSPNFLFLKILIFRVFFCDFTVGGALRKGDQTGTYPLSGGVTIQNELKKR